MLKNNTFINLENTLIVKFTELESTKELILQGLKTNKSNKYFNENIMRLREWLDSSLPVDVIVDDEESLLERAIRENNLAAVEYILTKSPSMTTPKGHNILLSILKIPHLNEDSIKIFKALASNIHAEINQKYEEVNGNETTAINLIKRKLFKIKKKTDNKKIINEFIEYINTSFNTNSKKSQDNSNEEDDDYKSNELTFSKNITYTGDDEKSYTSDSSSSVVIDWEDDIFPSRLSR